MEHTRISGTYGDEVDLYHEGYVGTKYSEFLKIKSVDFEKHEVDLYGEGTYDFSRIAYSTPEGKESYLDSLEYYVREHLDIKVGSIVKLSKLGFEDFKEDELRITEIRMPKAEGEDYLIKLGIQNTKTNKEYLYTIPEFTEFRTILEVIYTPHTLEEKLRKNLEAFSNFSGEIQNKDEYIKSLLEIFKQYSSK